MMSERVTVSSINCFIVEDHCDVVPIINSMIRAKLLPISGTHMIHFDSHPDLSLSKISVQNWNNMTSIYESLGSHFQNFNIYYFQNRP